MRREPQARPAQADEQVHPMRFVVRSAAAATLALSLALPVLAVGLASPAAADCGSDGIQWPGAPEDVRGVAFVGTALERVADTPERGSTSIRFRVDRVLDGEPGPETVVTPWCVADTFDPEAAS